MSDISDLTDSIGEHGLPLGLTAVGLIAVQKVFGPSLNTIGTELDAVLKDRITAFRARNLTKIAEKADRLNGEPRQMPHPRTVQRILNDATLYDDDLMQTYVAGLLAGSRNDDGSDDRPVYYLTLIDGLTARQLRFFHVTYSLLTARARSIRLHSNNFQSLSFGVENNELAQLVQSLSPTPDTRGILPEVIALEQAGLISDGHLSHEPKDRTYLRYSPTQLGALLFNWVHGIDDEDTRNFLHTVRPDIGLPNFTSSTGRFFHTMFDE